MLNRFGFVIIVLKMILDISNTCILTLRNQFQLFQFFRKIFHFSGKFSAIIIFRKTDYPSCAGKTMVHSLARSLIHSLTWLEFATHIYLLIYVGPGKCKCRSFSEPRDHHTPISGVRARDRVGYSRSINWDRVGSSSSSGGQLLSVNQCLKKPPFVVRCHSFVISIKTK